MSRLQIYEGLECLEDGKMNVRMSILLKYSSKTVQNTLYQSLQGRTNIFLLDTHSKIA